MIFYFADCLANVTGSVAIVVVLVICGSASSAACVTICIAGVVILVIFYFADCLANVTGSVAIVVVLVICGSASSAAYVTICIAGVVILVICGDTLGAANVTGCITCVIVRANVTIRYAASGAESVYKRMGNCTDFVCFIGVTTYGTCISGISRCGTSRSSFFGFIVVSDCAGSTADVTVCIASVFVNVSCRGAGSTADVTVCIASVFVNVSCRGAGSTADVAVCIASIFVNVSCRRAGSAADVTVCIASVFVNVCGNFTNFATLVTSGIASVIVSVLAFYKGIDINAVDSNLCRDIRDYKRVDRVGESNGYCLAVTFYGSAANGSNRCFQSGCIICTVTVENDFSDFAGALNGYLGVCIKTYRIGVFGKGLSTIRFLIGKSDVVLLPNLFVGGAFTQTCFVGIKGYSCFFSGWNFRSRLLGLRSGYFGLRSGYSGLGSGYFGLGSGFLGLGSSYFGLRSSYFRLRSSYFRLGSRSFRSGSFRSGSFGSGSFGSRSFGGRTFRSRSFGSRTFGSGSFGGTLLRSRSTFLGLGDALLGSFFGSFLRSLFGSRGSFGSQRNLADLVQLFPPCELACNVVARRHGHEEHKG